METGEPFRTCIDCEQPLTGFYIIEKAFVNGDAIYEYALCDSCSESLGEDISPESKKHVRKFIGFPLKPRNLNRCAKCKTPREEGGEHVIIGGFEEDKMLNLGLPLTLCGSCVDLLNEGMSKATRDRLDEFEREHFPGPPEMEIDLPKRPKPVLI